MSQFNVFHKKHTKHKREYGIGKFNRNLYNERIKEKRRVPFIKKSM